MGLLATAFRAYERLKSAHPRFWREDRAGLPPAILRIQVAGIGDLQWFLEGGRLAARSLESILRKNEIDPASIHALLDFGCGCGRVTRHLQEFSNAKIYGVDLHRDAIRWCARNLGRGEFSVNALAPPLSFSDRSFDLIYAFSVFTHLNDSLEAAWLREFHRILTPGGWLVASTHGEASAGPLNPEERRRFDQGERVTRFENVSGSNLCNAFHPRAALERAAARLFETVDFVAAGALGNPHQDLYLLRRR